MSKVPLPFGSSHVCVCVCGWVGACQCVCVPASVCVCACARACVSKKGVIVNDFHKCFLQRFYCVMFFVILASVIREGGG